MFYLLLLGIVASSLRSTWEGWLIWHQQQLDHSLPSVLLTETSDPSAFPLYKMLKNLHHSLWPITGLSPCCQHFSSPIDTNTDIARGSIRRTEFRTIPELPELLIMFSLMLPVTKSLRKFYWMSTESTIFTDSKIVSSPVVFHYYDPQILTTWNNTVFTKFWKNTTQVH